MSVKYLSFLIDEQEVVTISYNEIFEGEVDATKALLAYEHNCSVDNIKVEVTYKEDNEL